MPKLTLAVGADGKFAGLVVPALVARGGTVRGLVRNPAAAAGVRERGAAEVAIGDLGDAAGIARALDGVDAVFYIAPLGLPNEVAVGQSLVAAAIAAGVRRFVFSSVIHPVLSKLPNHALKAPIEEAVLDSDLEYTFLHPALFYQNYAASWARTIETGVLAEPWSNDTRFSRVDYRDIAEVAAIAIMEDRLLAGTFELCAQGHLDRHNVAALITSVVGRQVEARRIDPASLGESAKPMAPMFEHYDKFGLLGNSTALRAILGREPRTLRSYFEELAASIHPGAGV